MVLYVLCLQACVHQAIDVLLACLAELVQSGIAREEWDAPRLEATRKRSQKKDKKQSPAHALRGAVVEAIKAKDPAAALAAYDAAVANGGPAS